MADSVGVVILECAERGAGVGGRVVQRGVVRGGGGECGVGGLGGGDEGVGRFVYCEGERGGGEVFGGGEGGKRGSEVRGGVGGEGGYRGCGTGLLGCWEWWAVGEVRVVVWFG